MLFILDNQVIVKHINGLIEILAKLINVKILIVLVNVKYFIMQKGEVCLIGESGVTIECCVNHVIKSMTEILNLKLYGKSNNFYTI